MGTRETWHPGERPWFEYHCWKSLDSTDAVLWLHSHQRVTVIGEAPSDAPPDMDFDERAKVGQPKCYRVKFDNGLQWDVCEDELVESIDDFYRPAPTLIRGRETK